MFPSNKAYQKNNNNRINPTTHFLIQTYMTSIKTIFILVQFSPILRKRKKKHAKRKITQNSNKNRKKHHWHPCAQAKRQKKKSNSSGNPVYKNDRGREWRVRVKANLKHYFLFYRLYSIYESLRHVCSIFNNSLLQQTPSFLQKLEYSNSISSHYMYLRD